MTTLKFSGDGIRVIKDDGPHAFVNCLLDMDGWSSLPPF